MRIHSRRRVRSNCRKMNIGKRLNFLCEYIFSVFFLGIFDCTRQRAKFKFREKKRLMSILLITKIIKANDKISTLFKHTAPQNLVSQANQTKQYGVSYQIKFSRNSPPSIRTTVSLNFSNQRTKRNIEKFYPPSLNRC